jgi:HEAT repeat protein
MVSGATLGVAVLTNAAEVDSMDSWIAALKNPDDAIRGPATQMAGSRGAPAVKPLIVLMAGADFESARAAKRALWWVVRHAGRPGATAETRAVVDQLLSSLSGSASTVRRELLWMLSEIANDEAVEAMAALLADKEVREDARCALQRLPGNRATDALRKAFATAPEVFKFALAESLRARGINVEGYPSQKQVATKSTEVQAKPVK